MAFGVKKSWGGRYVLPHATLARSHLDYEKQKFQETQAGLQQEHQKAYNEILNQYTKYQSRQDDQASILKAYYLELLQDLADPKKARSVVKRWADGYVIGIGPKPSAISSKLPLPYRIKKVVKEKDDKLGVVDN